MERGRGPAMPQAPFATDIAVALAIVWGLVLVLTLLLLLIRRSVSP